MNSRLVEFAEHYWSEYLGKIEQAVAPLTVITAAFFSSRCSQETCATFLLAPFSTEENMFSL